MKMFKRFAAALLAGVMVLAMLTACGGNGGGGAPKSVEDQVADIYLSAMNAVLGTELSNDSTLAAKSKAALNSNMNDAGVITGKSTIFSEPDSAGKVLVTMISDEGITSAQAQQMTSNPAAVEAYINQIKTEMKAELKGNYDIYVAMMKAAIIGMGTGTVQKGGNYYVAVTVQVPKEVADGMRS